MAEAEFIEKPVGGNMKYIHHMDMSTREGPINSGGLQNVQLEGSIPENPTFPVGDLYKISTDERRSERSTGDLIGDG